MSVFWNSQRERWQYDFQRGGERYSGYCMDEKGKPVTSKRSAQDAEARMKAGIKAKPVAKANEPEGYTFAMAVADWSEHHGQHMRSWKNELKKLRELLDVFGAETPCEAITSEQVDRYISWSRTQRKQVNIGGPKAGEERAIKLAKGLRSDSTINRHLAALRTILKRAHQREHIAVMPRIVLLKEPEAAPNPVSTEDLRKIAEAAPEHLRLAAMLCTHTGMRMRECLRLRWDQIDLEEGTATLGTDTKAKRGRVLQLNRTSRELLEALPHREGPVVQFRGHPVSDVKKAWNSAQVRAGISRHYRFHDTRAAFCTMLAAKGVDPVHIRDLAGHRDINTTMRYVKPNDKRLRDAVLLLDD